MANDYRAVAKGLPISAQKTRLVVDLVRGKDVVDALNMLKFVQNRAAKPVYKVVRSAMQKRTSVSAEAASTCTRSLPMRAAPSSAAALADAGATSPACAGTRT